MSASIFARLHEAATGPAPDGLALLLDLADVRELDDFVQRECPDDSTCTICDARLCRQCDIGEPVECLADPEYHCHGCRSECVRCQQAMRGEARGW